MIRMGISVSGLEAIGRRFRRMPRKISGNVRGKLTRVGLLVQREAKRNAKYGPPGTNPGGLENSILFEVGADFVDILVPPNSQAGQYAKIQHDKLKGRGPGTRAKGGRAGWKYIERAIDDEEQHIEFILGDAAFENI